MDCLFKKCESNFYKNIDDGTMGPYLMFGQHTIEEASSDEAFVPSCIQQTSSMYLAHLVPPCPLILSSLLSRKRLCQVPCDGSFLNRLGSAKALTMCRKTKELKWVVFSEKGSSTQVHAGRQLSLNTQPSAARLLPWSSDGIGVFTAYLGHNHQLGNNYINRNTVPLGFFCRQLFPFKTHFPNGLIKK